MKICFITFASLNHYSSLPYLPPENQIVSKNVLYKLSSDKIVNHICSVLEMRPVSLISFHLPKNYQNHFQLPGMSVSSMIALLSICILSCSVVRILLKLVFLFGLSRITFLAAAAATSTAEYYESTNCFF